MKRIILSAVLIIAGAAEAGLSKPVQEWRRGPVRFLMTGEEEKAWKGVKSDSDAAAFIDLFWARRDPSVGSQRNEFREEFLSRVNYADASFAEKRSRGALTDRGQVYIVLGPPDGGTRGGMEVAAPTGLSGASARSADNVIWTWPRERAIELNVPRLVVTFNQQVGTNMYVRDTKHGQFTNASEIAIRKNIVNPDLTAVPEWAGRFGNEVLGSTVSKPAPAANANAAGRIGRVVLLADLGGLSPDADGDPVALLQPKNQFAVDDDIAFVVEYCGSTGPLKVEAKVAELSVTSELEPMPMKAIAGCGLVPSMMSLSGLGRGSHELVITTIEANGGRLTTKQRLVIQ